MPWQIQVAEVAGEVAPDGLPAYPEVVVTVPRQSGKTTLILGREVDRACWWNRPPTLGRLPQRVVYTAQTGLAASLKLVEDQILDFPRFPGLVGCGDHATAAGAVWWRWR